MEFAERLKRVPPYLFVEIDRLKQEKINQGAEVIDLGIGDPDLPTPKEIVEVAKRALEDPSFHRYPSSQGSGFFLKACANYMKRRFDVDFSPGSEIVALIGSKEGIAHFPLAFVNPGDVVLCPDPAYPVYHLGTIFAGGEPYYLPLTWERDFLPDLASIPKDVLSRAKILWLNYPNNPTGAMASAEFFAEALSFAKKHGLIIAHDAAYVEMSFDGRAMSIFQIPGAKDVAIEFHSLSKTFCMTGWRIGFAVGKRELVQGLAKIKSNVDSGVFTAIQYAGAYALDHVESLVPPIIKVFAERQAYLAKALKRLGFEFKPSSATFYLWVKVPNGYTSSDFCKKLLEELDIVVTPGSGFGQSGEGYLRVALTTGVEKLQKAVERLSTLRL